MEAAGGKGVIVTDPVTSAGMASYIASCGGQHDRFMMGYRNVIDRAADTQPEPALLAIETSGHSAWKDNRFVDDGTSTLSTGTPLQKSFWIPWSPGACYLGVGVRVGGAHTKNSKEELCFYQPFGWSDIGYLISDMHNMHI